MGTINFILSDAVLSPSNAHIPAHVEELQFSKIVHIFSVKFIIQFYFEYIIKINTNFHAAVFTVLGFNGVMNYVSV